MLKHFADSIAYTPLLKLDPAGHPGDTLNYLIYGALMVFLQLASTVYVMAITRVYFPPERTRRIPSHAQEFMGNIFAAFLIKGEV